MTITGTAQRVDRRLKQRINGRGRLVLNAYGGIYLLGLTPEDIYYTEPR